MKRAKSMSIHDRLEVLEAGVITSSRLREAAGAGRVAPDLRAGWTSMARTVITDSVVRTGTARAVAVVSRLAVFGMVLLVLGVPITDLWRFLFLVAAVVAICFGNIRHWGPRWLIALTIAIGGAAAAWLIQGPQIQEGNNVYIPVGESLKVFEAELPQQAQAAMKSVFEHAYFTNTDGLPGSADWWQYPAFATPGYFTKHAFAPSADALWEQPKYSRIVDMIDFRNQDQARIRAINRSRYNFYHRHRSQPHDFDTAARIDRSAMPYFVMAEINSELSGGKACWRGDVLWEDDDGKFSLAGRDAWGCQSLGERDIGKRVFALAIRKPVEFAVYPSLQLRFLLWIKQAIRSLGVIAVVATLVRLDTFYQLLLPIGSAVSTIVTTAVLSPQFLIGFRTQDGGNDGLVHQSLGFDIFQSVRHGDWADALRGGEDIFYFMPGLRYFRALEDFIFGDTNFGIVLCTMFLPIFLYYFLCRLLPLRLSVILILIFIFTPILEHLGFAHFLYIREMIKGFPEPIGYAAFLGGLALLARYVPTSIAQPLYGKMPTVSIGLAFALSVVMRPNLAVPATFLLAMVAPWLLVGKRWRELAGLVLGFAPVLLLTFHNWYFGHQFVPLTSSAFAPDNLLTPPSVYIASLQEILKLNLSGDNLALVMRQIVRWNGLSDFYRVFAVIVVFWVAIRGNTAPALRALAIVALSMQSLLLLYFPTGRYAYLAWLMVFVVFVVTFREVFLPWMRQKYPESWKRFTFLPSSPN